jgi:hypothetical protein
MNFNRCRFRDAIRVDNPKSDGSLPPWLWAGPGRGATLQGTSGDLTVPQERNR